VALPMRERQAIIKVMARRHVRAVKQERGPMRDELYALAGHNRRYAARLLRAKARGEPARRKRRRGRGAIDGAESETAGRRRRLSRLSSLRRLAWESFKPPYSLRQR